MLEKGRGAGYPCPPMDGIAPTIPFRVAQAYGVEPAQRVRPVQPPAPAQRVAAETESVASRPGASSRLVAGIVRGGIEFDDQGRGIVRADRAGALAMYARPGERNAAATGVEAGRVLDVKG